VKLTHSKKIIANDWVQLRELLNKVWDLGFVFAIRSLGGAYELLCQVRVQRVSRAVGFHWYLVVVQGKIE